MGEPSVCVKNDMSNQKLQWHQVSCVIIALFNPFAPGDFAEKRILKLVEWFSGHCRAIKS